MNTCPVCNAQNQPGALFCEMCGSRLQAAPPAAPPAAPSAAPSAAPVASVAGGAQCPTCGKAALPGEAFCDECGTPLGAAIPAAPQGVAAAPPSQPAPQASYPPPTPIAPAAASGCPSCGAATIPGEAFCDNCGASLLGAAAAPAPVAAAPVMPPPIQPAQPAPVMPPPVQPAPVAPAPAQPAMPAPVQPAAPAARLEAYVLRTASGAALALPAKGEAVIGREDAPSNNYPEVDLGPFDALAAGVGRRHARIFAQGGQIQIEDLDSTNGTAVNRQRLGARQPQILQVGDEIRLGKLLLTLQRQDATP